MQGVLQVFKLLRLTPVKIRPVATHATLTQGTCPILALNQPRLAALQSKAYPLNSLCTSVAQKAATMGKRGRDAPAAGKTEAGAQPQQKQKHQKHHKQAVATGNEVESQLSHYSSNIQVLAGDVDHNSPSLLLFVDKAGRMLFNAGEGLQRLFRENKLRAVKLDHYLFTRVSTETMAGLPGMLLSYGSGGSNNDAAGLLDRPEATSHLYGPAGMSSYISAFKPYVNQEQALSVHEFGAAPQQEPLMKTSHVTITPVVIQPRDAPAGPAPHSPPGAAVQYVVQLAGTPGKFDAQAAAKLGVFGRARGLLQKGVSVTLDDGTVIQPEQVRSPDLAGPLLLVLDLPSSGHLDSLIKGNLLGEWLKQEEQAGATPRLVLVAHLSAPHMVTSPAYQQWMSSLGPHVQHVLCSMGAHACTLKRAYALQVKLNCISPVLFPVLHPPSKVTSYASDAAQGVVPGAAYTPQFASLTGLSPHQAVLGTCLLRYTLTPITKQGIDVGEVAPELDLLKLKQDYTETAQSVIQRAEKAVGPAGGLSVKALPAPGGGDVEMSDAAGDAGAGEARQPAQAVEAVPECLQGVSREECEITFLGTASSQPSKYRNVTALYVDFFSRGGLLLDCGEDTLGQMKRRFGPEDAERRFLELAAVWISHLHADHHGGLYRLLELRAERQGAAATPLLIIGPGLLFPILRDYHRLLGFPFHFLPSEALMYGLPGRGPPQVVLDAYQQAVKRLGLASLQPFSVHHVGHACGIRLQGSSGWTVVFSGDTRPCKQVIEAARGGSLLIHEATFEDDKQEDAQRKKHSTTGEALQVAKEAGVYRVVLTHFSTRYPTMPVLDIQAHPDMAVACDFMRINLADLPWMPRITAPLAALFQHEEKGWEQDEQGAVPAAAAP